MTKGRPSSYRQEYAEQAHKLCLLGAIDADMADFFGVSETTLNHWKQAHPKFLASLTRGKAYADANVAERLYQRALGYSHEAVKIFMPSGTTEPVYAPYTEHYPPDTPAASLWLRNRQSGKWRDRVEHYRRRGRPAGHSLAGRRRRECLRSFARARPLHDERHRPPAPA